MTQSQRFPNRLIDETSPYLLQHAYNPVDWHPWGEEAFALAVEQDKPVFLSVGYSACHWCHVMEHESFESDEIAALMNEYFINIKVDREERPDVDQIYMSAVQLMTQRGGWPMSVFLTPKKEPFYGGTYWPPTSRMGMPGFREILSKIHEIWAQNRDEVTRSAGSLVDAINRMAAPQFETSKLDDGVLRTGMREILRSADRTHGGFGGAPKFPHPMDLRVLLRCGKRFDNADALDVVTLTLDKMARGGIYDHLGGGFHRYSTDARWLVPHFEKMLYDNALLVPAYLELGQILRNKHTKEPWPFAVARETLDYVLREMEQPEGGFFSTQDADSEGEEGKFFVWSEAEIDTLLSEADAGLFKYAYDVTPGGNWEGKNILNRPKPHDEAARMLDVDSAELAAGLARSRRNLLSSRDQRVKPGRDDKVLVSWNGWMISAMSQASRVLGDMKYAEAATRAAEFVLGNLRSEESFLLHAYKDGRARFNAYLDDYAALISGLTDLYQATFEVTHLETARELASQMIERFGDQDTGGFFYTSHDHEALIARPKDSQDNATPSGNSQAATALIQLGRLTGHVDFTEKGRTTLESFSGLLSEHPRAAGQGLLALDAMLGPTQEVVISEGDRPSLADDWVSAIRQEFLPNMIVLRRQSSMTDESLPDIIRPHLEGRTAREGRTTAYVCREMTCGPPLMTVEELIGALRQG